MLNEVKPGKVYRNKKNRQFYYVMTFVKHSETLEDMVFYVALYQQELSKNWVRPVELFKEKFEEVV